MNILTSLLLLATVSAIRGSWIVAGVFDTKEQENSFKSSISGDPAVAHLRVKTYLVSQSLKLISEELCSEDSLLYIYSTISSRYVISVLHNIAQSRNAPLFAYDLSMPNLLQQDEHSLSGPALFYLNSFSYSEGRAWAEVVGKSGWSYINVIVQENLHHDHLFTAFKDNFKSQYGGDLHELIIPESMTAKEMLIQYHQGLPTQTTRRFVSYEVMLVHASKQFTEELLSGAELLFHDRQIIWLFTAYSYTERLQSARFPCVTLGHNKTDLPGLISDTVQSINKVLVIQELPPYITETLRHSGDCQNTEPSLAWQRHLTESGLVRRNSILYYKFAIYATQVGGTNWHYISSVDSIHGQRLPNIADALYKGKREKYTVVTVSDKPFVMVTEPSVFDGRLYCRTPTISCLSVNESLIRRVGYNHTETVRDIFKVFDMGKSRGGVDYSLQCCEGFSVDLLKTLTSELEVDFQLYLVPDGQFGAFDVKEDRWSGLVGELVDKRADMVMASFSITVPRSVVIDYSAPYYHSGFSILSITRPSTETNWLLFFEPFTTSMWFMIIFICVVVFCALALLEWCSPRGMNSKHDSTEVTYTLSSAIKTIFSMLCGHTIPTKMPLSVSAKILQCIWGCFSIIYLAAYTANLTSKLADRSEITQVNDIYDDRLLNLKVAALKNSAAETYIKLIRPDLYNHIKDYSFTTADEAVQALRNGDLDIFMHDSPVIDYIVSRENYNCDLKKLSSFSVDSYGAAFPRDTHADLKLAVNSKILEYHVSGYIERLRKIYFPTLSSCTSVIPSGEDIQLDLVKASGLLMSLCGFIVICSLLVLCEHAVYKYLVPFAKGKPPTSCWRGLHVLFISQRLYRAIVKTGDSGWNVVRLFMARFRKMFSLNEMEKSRRKATLVVRLSLSSESKKDIPHNFYDVVAMAYKQRYKKPIETIWLKKSNKNSAPSLQTMLKVHKQNLTMPSLVQYTSSSVSLGSALTATTSAQVPTSDSCPELHAKSKQQKNVTEYVMNKPASDEMKKPLNQTLSNGIPNGESLDTPGEFSSTALPAAATAERRRLSKNIRSLITTTASEAEDRILVDTSKREKKSPVTVYYV